MPSKNPPAIRPTDALDREVALKVHLDQTGLTVGGKSRALAAFDRLLGGIIGWPAEFFEGKRAQAQARGEAREALIRAEAEADLKRLKGLGAMGMPALQRFLRDEYRKQDNRAAVAAYATDQLIALPQPAAEQGAAEQSTADVDPPELDEDWINTFSGYVDRASSECLRDLWGRVLAGEIRKPGTFAPATLRAIAEMDAKIAHEFQEVYRLSVKGCNLLPEPFEGAIFEKIAFLEEVGLVKVDLNVRFHIEPTADGFGYFWGDEVGLRVTYIPDSGVVSFPVVRITRVGMQIGTILPQDQAEALRHIGRALTAAEKVEFCVATGRQGQDISFQVTEILHEM